MYAHILINTRCYATKGKYFHMLIIFLSPFACGNKWCYKIVSKCTILLLFFYIKITWPKRSHYSFKLFKYISSSTLVCSIWILWHGQKMQFPTRKKLYNQVCDKDNWRGVKIENICKYVKTKECKFWGGVSFVLHFSFKWLTMKLSSKTFSFLVWPWKIVFLHFSIKRDGVCKMKLKSFLLLQLTKFYTLEVSFN